MPQMQLKLCNPFHYLEVDDYLFQPCFYIYGSTPSSNCHFLISLPVSPLYVGILHHFINSSYPSKSVPCENVFVYSFSGFFLLLTYYQSSTRLFNMMPQRHLKLPSEWSICPEKPVSLFSTSVMVLLYTQFKLETLESSIP